MVIDYRDAWQALRARQVLEGAGLAVRCTPNALLCLSAEPTITHRLVYRLEVPAGASATARALLEGSDLWPPPDAEMVN
jgi:hypothetical protein